ncbi:MAG: H-X9-DG-CTERM domain-containing protein [Candidatus Zipacnadales bacterium]
MQGRAEPTRQSGTTAGNYAWASRRHNEGCNYNFSDGHAKWVKVATVSSTAAKASQISIGG